MAKPKFVADPEIGKQNVRAALERLENFVGGLTNAEAFKGALRKGSVGNLRKYSLRNQALMLLHRPDADHIGTAAYWFGKGRLPVKGAGTHLLMPRQFTVKDEVEADTPGAVVAEDGTAYIEKMIRAFKAVMYWDVRDTTDRKGNPWSPPAPRPEVKGRTPITDTFDLSADEAERAAEIEGAVIAQIKALGCKFSWGKLAGAYGGYRNATCEIIIDPDQDALKRCGTVTHEAAHLLEYKLGTRGDYNLGELVAEGAAFVVLSRYHLDTSAFSFGYVERYGADKAMFRKGLGAIQQISNAIIESIERDDEEVAA